MLQGVPLTREPSADETEQSMNMDDYNNYPDFADPPQMKHRGTFILVMGIMGFLTGGIMGAVAWALGNADLRKMNVGLMDSKGMDRTEYGRILGIISVILSLSAAAIYFLYWSTRPTPIG